MTPVFSLRAELLHGFLLPILWIGTRTISTYSDDTSETVNRHVNMARCHVNCFDKFRHDSLRICKDATACYTCLQMCERLAMDYGTYWYICGNSDLCLSGCPAACNFIDSMTEEINQNSASLRVTKILDKNGITLSWKNYKQGNYRQIFIIFRQNDHDPAWRYLTETVETSISFKSEIARRRTVFRVVAVDLYGRRADSNQSASDKRSKSGQKKRRVKRNRLIEVRLVPRNHTFTTILKLRQPSVGNATDVITYRMKIYRHDCNVYKDIKPICDIGSNITVANMSVPIFKKHRTVNVTFDYFLYNTNYEIKIYYELHGDIRWLGKVDFNTPKCKNVVKYSYRYCQKNQETTKSPLLSDKIDAKITSISRGQKIDQVLVNIKWLPVINSTDAKYHLSWESFSSADSAFINQRSEATPHGINVTLTKGLPYKMLVTGRSGDGHYAESNYFYLNPEDLDIVGDKTNVSYPGQHASASYNVSVSATGEAGDLKDTKVASRSERWIVAAMCLGGAVTFLVIGLVVYKKRKAFKDPSVPKNFPLQCNNYMYKNTSYAAVANKQYYTNDMVYVPDEWEVDPSSLQFSCVLGQGAFGKVMTAFFTDRRVAVKVVREGAPITYKEDLLAEIDLLKKLGCHPNIVSLVGSCTLSEPIALIMEYVPYGNLQNFLKKCRLENELRRMGGESGEMTYTIIDAHGSIEEGVITPADILTFARQIAMAMNYLAEKKYVHRDLAARNVLLDYNKVVKVCDFGLSRDIFNNDNHYKKLTSGKLPLKWMALESLRDRVFTTSSDVWSFGILLWEIVTMGASPYPHVALSDLFYLLSNGFRMDKPSNCSDDLYIIMRWCWAERPQDRPSFSELRDHIEALLTKDCNYLDLDSIDVPLDSDNTSSDMTNPVTAGTQVSTVSGSDDCGQENLPSTEGLLKRVSFVDPMPLELTEFREQLAKMKSTNI